MSRDFYQINQISKKLIEYGKARITERELRQYISVSDYEEYYKIIVELVNNNIITPVKNSGFNGRRPPLYKRYNIIKPECNYDDLIPEIRLLSDKLNIEGYLADPEKYKKHKPWLLPLDDFLKHNSKSLETSLSINERSFQIFKKEKALREEKDLAAVLSFNPGLTEVLNYYHTPEPFFLHNITNYSIKDDKNGNNDKIKGFGNYNYKYYGNNIYGSVIAAVERPQRPQQQQQQQQQKQHQSEQQYQQPQQSRQHNQREQQLQQCERQQQHEQQLQHHEQKSQKSAQQLQKCEQLFQQHEQQLNILIIENKDTWYTLKNIMSQNFNCLTGIKFDSLIYGEGKKIARKMDSLTEFDKSFFHGVKTTYYYFGDLDYEGIGIFYELFNVNPMLDIKLMKALYITMLDASREIIEQLPVTKEKQVKKTGQLEWFVSFFDPEHQVIIKNILESDRYIPQEILNNEDFKELLKMSQALKAINK